MQNLVKTIAWGFFLGSATLHGAGQQVVLGPTADFALNQPYVEFSMSNGNTTLGPNSANQTFLLDTAATSVVAVSRAASDLNRSSGNFSTGVFEELGVGGTIDYFVSEPYRMHIAGDNGTLQIDNTKILSDPNQNFGQPELGFEPFVGIAGQPVMVDRVTTLDFVPKATGGIDLTNLNLSALSSVQLNVGFGSSIPASNGHRYSIPMTAEHFEPEGVVTPTAAPLAMVEVTQRIGCEQSSGRYAFDTGAQLSIMNTGKLADMGLTAADATGSVDIQGVGGTRSVPIYSLDEFRIETSEGIDLVYREADGSSGIQVIGLDLPKIDGVIGADILSQDGIDPNDLGDIIGLILGGGLGEAPDNPIDEVHLDFRDLQRPDQNGTGTMYFDLKSQFDNVTPSDRVHLADGNADGKVDEADRLIWQANNGRTETRCATGDYNRDGRTDAADLAVWEAGANGVDPEEPASCDFNGDDTCDASDLDMLLDALGSANQPEFNLDPTSQEIDFFDRDAWLTIAGNKEAGSPYLLGDVNFDGTVDPADLNALGQNWTKDSNVGYADGDIDGDDLVGPSDLNQIGQNWLKTSQPAATIAAVPEPSSVWILFFGTLPLVAMARRCNGPSS